MKTKSYPLLIIPFALCCFCYPQDIKKENVVEHRLPNGPIFLLVEKHSENSFSLFMRVKVGSIDETIENSGVSHLLEHIFLKEINAFINNTNFEENKIDKKNFKIGAETTKELTTYYFKLPACYLEPLLLNISRKLKNPSFESLEGERARVIEEIKTKSENILRARVFDIFISLAYLRHPYRLPARGLKESLKKIDKISIEKFFYDHYKFSNIIFALVGNFRKKDLMSLIQNHFQHHSPISQERNYPEELHLNGELGERRIKFYNSLTPYIMIGFYKPVYPSREDYIFDIGAYLLERYLNDSLVNKRKSASFVRVFLTPGIKFTNLLVIEAMPVKSSSKLESLIYKEIKKFLSNPLSWNLDETKIQIKQKLYKFLTSDFSLASNLSYYEAIYKNWRYIFEYLESINGIKIRDIHKTLSNYLLGNNKVVLVLENKELEVKNER